MTDSTSSPSEPLPPYSAFDPSAGTGPYLSTASAGHDPRTSSQQSLISAHDAGDTRRRLLLIYIHGFMGTETSFQSFPAHVHNLVTILLAESHTVHTKIYPRYKSRSQLGTVAEDFSKWLRPHETPGTDVILLGHSMGGLLSAEVALLGPRLEFTGRALRHHIIGLINFDVPFLGMAPGIISTGLASIFNPAEKSPPASPYMHPADGAASSSSADVGTPPPRQSTLFAKPTDPNYNPSFENDVHLPIRKGWKSTMHFINKHSDGLRQATKQYVKSHIEFGGAMANYHELHQRYNKVRALEEPEESPRRKAIQPKQSNAHVARVRFVNYYTACSGRPKKPKPVDGGEGSTSRLTVSQIDSRRSSRSSLIPESDRSPRISVEEVRGNEVVPVPIEEPLSPLAVENASSSLEHRNQSSSTLEKIDSGATDGSADTAAIDKVLASGIHVNMPMWPILPPEPMQPAPPDLSWHKEKLVQDAMKKEHERNLKVYKQTLKDREITLVERKKVEEKIRRNAAKEELKKRNKDADKIKDVKVPVVPRKPVHAQSSSSSAAASTSATPAVEIDRSPTLPQRPQNAETMSVDSMSVTTSAYSEHPSKPAKERRFCTIPPKNQHGDRDPSWVRVDMGQMDEVTAHTSLFLVNDAYERLVGEVSGKIEEWVVGARDLKR